MHINVTIPTFNRADGPLQRAIEGALAQTHIDLSVTVVDDGSTDATAAVLRQYASDDRFAAIRLGRNVGTARAKNVGLYLGRYDAITFHDSDDVVEEIMKFIPIRVEIKRKTISLIRFPLLSFIIQL